MLKLTITILTIFSVISFILGYNFYLYYNPIRVCEVCKECVISDIKSIVSDTPVVLEAIESNGQEVAECDIKLKNCWWNFESVKAEFEELKTEVDILELTNKEYINKISELESNLIACEIYQVDINGYIDKLKQDLKEAQNSLDICYQLNN